MALALIYLVVAGMGLIMTICGNIPAIVFTFFGIIFFVLFAAAPFLPPKPWTWIYGLVLIIRRTFGLSDSPRLHSFAYFLDKT